MTENDKFYVVKLNNKLYLDKRIEPCTIATRHTFTKNLDSARRYINLSAAREKSKDLGGYVVEVSYQFRRLEAEPHD